MRKLDFHVPGVKGANTSAMSSQDKKQVAEDRQRRERLKRQLRLLYDDVAREDVPDALMALVDRIGNAPAAGGGAEHAGETKKKPAPE
ncbi:MAG: NepR family anti-sigma factor [Ferrovibrionaceae bacterium]